MIYVVESLGLQRRERMGVLKTPMPRVITPTASYFEMNTVDAQSELDLSSSLSSPKVKPDPLPVNTARSVEFSLCGIDLERFELRIDKSGGATACWPWIHQGNDKGYGKFRFNGLRIKSHRLAYVQHFGPIPEGIMVLHKCDNPPCCNPAHLFLGKDCDNNADKENKGRARHPIGNDNGRSKLTEADVRRIRALIADGTCYQNELASAYSVTPTSIWAIVHRHNWAHVIP